MAVSYGTVTELPEEMIPQEQLSRISERYHWAAGYSKGKDVLECACGAGQGASILNHVSSSYAAGDLDENLVSLSRRNNPDILFKVFGASRIPFDDDSFDVVLACEAIYYFPDISEFLKEAKRVLKKNGKILIVSANPNLFDFNPSPFTYVYPSINDMRIYFHKNGFKFLSAQGGTNISKVNMRQKLLRPIKFVASKLNLIPKTMTGKSWLKKLFFGGNFVAMPRCLKYEEGRSVSLDTLSLSENDYSCKVLYFVGEKK